MPLYFDAHSHLNDVRFNEDRALVLSHMREAGVWSVVVGTDKKMSEDAVLVAQENEGIFAAIGLHPTDDEGEIWNDTEYRELAGKKNVVAIGECGLDYSRVPEEKRKEEEVRQKALFEKELELAVSCGLPLMIHCRDAHPDLIDMLVSKKKEYGEKLRGNIHFFSEGPETAKKYFDLDFTISFTGVLTFARNYDEAVRYAPLTHILSETDAPYVAPAPYRGKRNEPIYVQEVVKAIANIRNEDSEKVRIAMVENAFRAFSL
jgi:TatD DNase family protein